MNILWILIFSILFAISHICYASFRVNQRCSWSSFDWRMRGSYVVYQLMLSKLLLRKLISRRCFEITTSKCIYLYILPHECMHTEFVLWIIIIKYDGEFFFFLFFFGIIGVFVLKLDSISIWLKFIATRGLANE